MIFGAFMFFFAALISPKWFERRQFSEIFWGASNFFLFCIFKYIFNSQSCLEWKDFFEPGLFLSARNYSNCSQLLQLEDSSVRMLLISTCIYHRVDVQHENIKSGRYYAFDLTLQEHLLWILCEHNSNARKREACPITFFVLFCFFKTVFEKLYFNTWL